MTRPSPQRQTLLRRCSIFCRTVAFGWLALGGLAACSAVPDAVNPVEWYRGVAGVFEDDEQQQERAVERTAREATPLPGTDKPYPNLATVPDRPRITPPAERGKVAQGLLADRENARYAESESSGGQAAAPEISPLPEPPPPAASAVMAAPRVSPPEPVPAPPLPQPVPQSTAVQARETPMPVPTRPSAATFPLGVTQSATVFFANGSAAIDADGKRALRILAEGYKENGGALRVVGFASGQATSASAQIANFRIAGQRAEAVAQELVRLGVPMTRMIVSSGNAGAGDAALARRVEVSLDY
jgi:outer membrane protein OmpA-like peptidoglycan-associated protein